MKKKLLGIFDIKKMTPEQIFEKAELTLKENERLELLGMAKAGRKRKNETKTGS